VFYAAATFVVQEEAAGVMDKKTEQSEGVAGFLRAGLHTICARSQEMGSSLRRRLRPSQQRRVQTIDK
jgi:hypothetical protein